jgi:hypothetical protein
MTSSSLKKEIVEKLDLLPIEQQRKVLDFTRALTQSKTVGIPGRDLLRFAGTIEKTELESMTQAIEDGCERVDLNEW